MTSLGGQGREALENLKRLKWETKFQDTGKFLARKIETKIKRGKQYELWKETQKESPCLVDPACVCDFGKIQLMSFRVFNYKM